MPVQHKKANKRTTVTAEVGSYEKHPFFVQKKAVATAFLEQAGLPKELNKNTGKKVFISHSSQHVVRHGDRWAVKAEGKERATKITPTQQQAIAIAREIARSQNSEVIIHGRDGKIRDRNSYAKSDQAPAKDLKRSKV